MDIKESATDPVILGEISREFAHLVKSEIIGGMSRIGIEGADLVAINTDAAHLYNITSKGKLLIGKRRTGGERSRRFPRCR